MFDEFVEFCRENGASDPTTVECYPNVDVMARPSTRGSWLHGESICSCTVELKAPMIRDQCFQWRNDMKPNV